MPSRTLEDKVEDLTKLSATHGQQLKSFDESLNRADAKYAKTDESLHALKNIVVRLEQQMAEFDRRKVEVGLLTDIRRT